MTHPLELDHCHAWGTGRAAGHRYCQEVQSRNAGSWKRRRYRRGVPSHSSLRPLSELASAALNLDPIVRTCGLRRGLKTRRPFAAGQEIARELPLVICSGDSSSSTATALPAAAHALRDLVLPDVPLNVRSLFESSGVSISPEALLVFSLLVLRWSGLRQGGKSSPRSACVPDLPEGPRHWLALSETKRSLFERCATVQRLMSEARLRGLLAFEVSDDDVLDADLRRIGSTLCSSDAPFVPAAFALLNHSCSPNAMLQWSASQGHVILSCLEPIAVGEEIFVSYVCEQDHVLSRRYYLLQQQGFRCLCKRCQSNFCGVVEAPVNGWRCESCSACLPDDLFQCSSCSSSVTLAMRCRREERHAKVMQLASRASTLARSQQFTSAAQLLARALESLRSLRPPTDVWLSRLLTSMRNVLLAAPPGSVAPDAVKAIDAELERQSAAYRAAVAAEAVGAASLGVAQSEEARSWSVRMLRALRLHDPSEIALRRGRKRRVGPRGDGGYVVWDEEGSPLCNALLSYGVDTNVDFELELACAGAKVLMFDHTVRGPPQGHPNITFRREALADRAVEGICGTLAAHLAALPLVPGPIMLKADVEGAEFAAILSTPSEDLAKFSQICLELHWLGRPSRGGDFRIKALALERLSENFVLLHAHGNNYGDAVEVAGCTVPDVLEVLFVNRSFLDPEGFVPSSRGLVPDVVLDSSNCLFVPDFELRGPPFGADVLAR